MIPFKFLVAFMILVLRFLFLGCHYIVRRREDAVQALLLLVVGCFSQIIPRRSCIFLNLPTLAMFQEKVGDGRRTWYKRLQSSAHFQVLFYFFEKLCNRLSDFCYESTNPT